MGDVTIRNVSGRGALDIDIAGVRATWVCEDGGTVDVPAELAGRAPVGEPGDDDYDPGEGLLAQPSNWQLAGAGDGAHAARSDDVGSSGASTAPDESEAGTADDTSRDASSDEALAPHTVEV